MSTCSDGPGGVLERVADRVADDGRRVRVGALAEHVAVVVLEVARLDVLLGVVPGAAAVVQDGRQQDAARSCRPSGTPATASAPSSRPTTIGVADREDARQRPSRAARRAS